MGCRHCSDACSPRLLAILTVAVPLQALAEPAKAVKVTVLSTMLAIRVAALASGEQKTLIKLGCGSGLIEAEIQRA